MCPGRVVWSCTAIRLQSGGGCKSFPPLNCHWVPWCSWYSYKHIDIGDGVNHHASYHFTHANTRVNASLFLSSFLIAYLLTYFIVFLVLTLNIFCRFLGLLSWFHWFPIHRFGQWLANLWDVFGPFSSYFFSLSWFEGGGREGPCAGQWGAGSAGCLLHGVIGHPQLSSQGVRGGWKGGGIRCVWIISF